MGRIASTLTPAVSRLPSEGGLLLDPATDLWADWGLLGVPDPDRATTTRQGLLFRDFIRSAFPSFQFHRLSELLIDLLQQVADGQLTRLIVCCPPRAGKSVLVSRLFPAYWVSRHPELFCAIASYSGECSPRSSRCTSRPVTDFQSALLLEQGRLHPDGESQPEDVASPDCQPVQGKAHDPICGNGPGDQPWPRHHLDAARQTGP